MPRARPMPRARILLGVTLGCTLLHAAHAQTPCDPLRAPPIFVEPRGELDETGDSIAIHQGTLVVGSPIISPPGAFRESGAAIVFEKSQGQWVQRQILSDPEVRPGTLMGHAVAVHNDTIVVTSPISESSNGQVFVWTRSTDRASDQTWQLQANIKAPTPGLYFGFSVALHDDTLVVGHPVSETNATGSVHVFTRSGTTWTHAATLVPSSSAGIDAVGWAVDIDQGWIAVSSPYESTFPATGSVTVFEGRDDTWDERQRLIPDDALFDEQVGTAVALEYPTLAIASSEADARRGSVWLYRHDPALGWRFEQKLAPPIPAQSPVSVIFFGDALDLQDQVLAVGAPYWNFSGAAFTFERLGGRWIRTFDLLSDQFETELLQPLDLGRSVGVSNGVLAAGAPFTLLSELFIGAAFAAETPSQTFAVTDQPQPQELRAPGDTVSFSTAAAAPSPLSFRWLRDGVALEDGPDVTGAHSPTLVIEQITEAHQGMYQCRITADGCGERLTEPVPLAIGPCLVIESFSPDAMVAPEAPLTLRVVPRGIGPFRYEWYRNGARLRDSATVFGTDTDTLTINPTIPTDAGAYRCVVRNPCYGVGTSLSDITFEPCVTVTRQPEQISPYEREILALSVQTSSTRPTTFQWFLNDEPLEDGPRVRGAQSPNLFVHPAEFNDSGSYHCVASCAFSAERSSDVIVTVRPRPCFGDASGDRLVSMIDFSAVLVQFGRTYSHPSGQGDADFDLDVDFDDITVVAGNFGFDCR